jgi:hypothetical protein
MKKWCREHEDKVLSALNEGKITPELLAEHEKKLNWLQHERLVHLIVTVMTVIVELFILDLTLLHPELGILPVILMLGFAILLGFYFYHYFFLENTVQRWYRIAEEIDKELNISN